MEEETVEIDCHQVETYLETELLGENVEIVVNEVKNFRDAGFELALQDNFDAFE